MPSEKDFTNQSSDIPELKTKTPIEPDFVEPKIPNSEDLDKWLKNNLTRELSAPKGGGNGWTITEVRPDDNTVTLIRHNFSGPIDKIIVDKKDLFLENRHLNERNGWKPDTTNESPEEKEAVQSLEAEEAAEDKSSEYESVLDKAAKIDLIKEAVAEERLYNPSKSNRDIIEMMRNFDESKGGWFGSTSGITNEHLDATLADLEKEDLKIDESNSSLEKKENNTPEDKGLSSGHFDEALTESSDGNAGPSLQEDIKNDFIESEESKPKDAKGSEPEPQELLLSEEEFEQLKPELQKQMEEILNGAYIESQEALRAKERYGKTKIISWLKEKLGTERIRIKDVEGIGLEISSGKDNRWWNPAVKAMIGGASVIGTTLATPSMAVGLGAFGAAYLTRAAVESGKLFFEKKKGIHQAIESSYIAKYQKALELAEKAKKQEGRGGEAFADALLEMQNFIDNVNDEAVEKNLASEAREDIKTLSIKELEEKQRKFERKWKIAESIAGLAASFGAGTVLHTELAQSLISGNAAAVKKFAETMVLENFNGGDIMHHVMKTKDGWVFLYNDLGEPARIAEAMGTTKWLDKLTILDYGEFGAHSVGEKASAILEGQLGKFENALNIDAAEALASARVWLTGVIGALSMQTAYDIFSNLKSKNNSKETAEAKEAYKAISEKESENNTEPPEQEELNDLNFKSSTSKMKEAILSQIFKKAEATQSAAESSKELTKEFTEKLKQVEPIKKEIARLKEKWIGKTAQINVNTSGEKVWLSIGLDGKNYPLQLNPSALLAISRSNDPDLRFNVQIQDFIKEGTFIHTKGATSELDPNSLEATLGIKPEQTLENLKSDYVGKKINVAAKTVLIGSKEYTTFVFSSKESPAMKDINYRFEFTNPNEAMKAKNESEENYSANLEVKSIELRYDSETEEPVYIFKV